MLNNIGDINLVIVFYCFFFVLVFVFSPHLLPVCVHLENKNKVLIHIILLESYNFPNLVKLLSLCQ